MKIISFCLDKKVEGHYCFQYESHGSSVGETFRFKFRGAPRVPDLKYVGCPTPAGGC